MFNTSIVNLIAWRTSEDSYMHVYMDAESILSNPEP